MGLAGSIGRVRVFSATITLLTNLVMIPTICMFDNRRNLNTDNPKLVFVALPGMFGRVPTNKVVKFLFFILMFFTTVADSVSMVRTVISSLVSGFGLAQVGSYLVIVIVYLVVNVPSSLNGNM